MSPKVPKSSTPIVARLGIPGFLSALLLVALAGCSKPSDSVPEPKTDTTSTGVTSPEKTASGEPSGEPTADSSTIPDDLKSEAYEYYGLSNDKPIKLEVTVTGRAPQSGEQTVKFVGMKDGNAQFNIMRSGDLAMTLGDQDVELRKDGVYTTKSSLGTMEGSALEVPAKLTPGYTWKSNQSVTTADNRKLQTDATYKVVGPQKVKTKAGEFDAILVTANGSVTLNGTKQSLTAKQWLAKGYGLVKSEMSTKDQSGQLSQVSIQLTK